MDRTDRTFLPMIPRRRCRILRPLKRVRSISFPDTRKWWLQKEIRRTCDEPIQNAVRQIEIFSQRLADLNDPELPPIPKFIPSWEGTDDLLANSYPLQLITIHFKTRAHSCFDNIPRLRDLEPHRLWIHPADANARGINAADDVIVFNQRGKVRISAYVTHRIMPGIVAMGEGACTVRTGKESIGTGAPMS